MKKVIFVLCTAAFLVACGPEKKEDKKEEAPKQDTVALYNSGAEKKYEDPTLPPSTDYTGDHVVKYANGITQIRGFFRFGKKHGTWTAFFPTGEVQSETQYDNGKKHGRITVFYPTGKMMYEGEFKNDERSGTWKTYDETGKVTEEKKY